MRQQRQRRVRTFLNPLNGPLQNQPKISLMISLEIVPIGLASMKKEMCVSWRKCLRLGEWQSCDRVSRCLREFFNKAHYWRRFPQICTAQEIDGIKDFPIMSYQLSKKFLSLLSRWSLALKLTRKRFFLSVEQFIVKTQFEISKYLLSISMSSNICGAVLEDLFNLSPKLWRFEGKKEKESMVICEVLYILSTRPTNM